MSVHEAKASSGAGQTVAEIVDGLSEAALHVVWAHCLVFVLSSILESEQTAGVDEGLEAKRSLLAQAGKREEQRGSTSGVDIATKSVLAFSWTKSRESETADVSRTTKLEAVVDPALRGSGLATESQRVEKTAAQTGSERDTAVTFDTGNGDRNGSQRLELEFAKSDIALEGTKTSKLSHSLEQVAARGHHRDISGVGSPGVGERGLEAVASVGANAGRGLLRKTCDLSP